MVRGASVTNTLARQRMLLLASSSLSCCITFSLKHLLSCGTRKQVERHVVVVSAFAAPPVMLMDHEGCTRYRQKFQPSSLSAAVPLRDTQGEVVRVLRKGRSDRVVGRVHPQQRSPKNQLPRKLEHRRPDAFASTFIDEARGDRQSTSISVD